MSKYNDGGAAFPSEELVTDDQGRVIRAIDHKGISTRLYIAAKLLPTIVRFTLNNDISENIVQSLRWADALIAQDKADRESGQ